MKKIILTIFVLGLFGVISAQEKKEPTLDETINYIKTKTIGKEFYEYYNHFAFCTEFTLDTNNYVLYFGGGPLEWPTIKRDEFCIDLREITDILEKSDCISFKPYKLLSVTVINTKYNSIEKNKVPLMIYYDKEDLPRMVKAWKHLLKLLKIEPPKELF